MKKIWTIVAFMCSAFTLSAQQQGTLDPTFDPGTGFDGDVYAMAVQPDGKVVAGGSFTSFDGNTNYSTIARLNADGTLDPTFAGSGSNGILIFALAVQPDGKILAGGLFTSINGQTGKNIVRLNNDGTLDTTFHPGTGFNNSVYAFCIQPDGKIVVGGSFTSFNGTTCNRIARLNSDGSLDASFSMGTAFNSTVTSTPVVYAFALQPDSNIVVAGDFTSYDGSTCNYITRLKKDGTLDATFDPGTGFDAYPSAVALQPDGKIVVGGGFTTFNGGTCNRITRLNSDGSLDATFNTGTGITFGNVNGLVLQDNGSIVIAGLFVAYNGVPARFITRVDSNGTLDATFSSNIGGSFDNYVLTIAGQPDQKVLVAGGFTAFDSTSRSRIARLNGENNIRIDSIPSDGYCSGQPLAVPFTASGDYGSGNVFTAQLSNASGDFTTPVTIGTLTAAGSGTIMATIPAATMSGTAYRIRVISSTPAITGRENDSDLTIHNMSPAVITVNGFQLSTTVTYSSYQWLSDGAAIPAATGDTYTVDHNGHYAVAVTNEAGCTDTSDEYIVTNYTGIAGPAEAEKITVYPNPVKDVLYIQAPFPVNVTLTDMTGKALYRDYDVHALSVKKLAAGVYFLRITDKNGMPYKTEKIVK